MTTTDVGSGFGAWEQVEPGVNVLGHVRPRWDDTGALHWARRDAGQLEVCRLATTLVCAPVEADALDSITLDAGTVWLNVAQGWTWSAEPG